jgi:hypothetical protein
MNTENRGQTVRFDNEEATKEHAENVDSVCLLSLCGVGVRARDGYK